MSDRASRQLVEVGPEVGLSRPLVGWRRRRMERLERAADRWGGVAIDPYIMLSDRRHPPEPRDIAGLAIPAEHGK
jgi:hypothetical protein